MKKFKILVVDDEPNLSRGYARILESAGYEVRQAATGAECLKLAGEESPDLILLDVMLPDMSGVEVSKRVKADPRLAGIFVINISGQRTSADSQAEGLEAGADGYLTKPLQPRMLLAHVRALLRIKGAEEALRESEERHRQMALELLEANRRLEEYNRLKAEFVANMSHELRTPLTAIIGFAQLAQLSAGKESAQQKAADAFERILRNGRHLLSLIDDVLDISKIEAGRMRIHAEHFDVTEVVEAAFGELQSLAQRKGIGYRFRVRDKFPLAFTDPLRVRQIVINLLSNAIKFTARGAVEVELSPRGENEFAILVRDTGVGIDERALNLIFERFRQVDASMTRSAGGAGLGLSIVRQIVRLLGGHIEVASVPGEGSAFTVTLPLVLPDSEAREAPEVRGGDSPAPDSASQFEGESAADADDDKPLVLIVEDDRDAASLLAETISQAGYRVRVATNGSEGLELARRLDPAIVTLDVMMPGRDGWQVLKALKADERTSQIPVIVCSIIDNRVVGYDLGASDYLLKPVEPERLVLTLRGVTTRGAETDEGYVLVVDDDHGVRELLAHALKNAGFNARTAASGETALRMISTVAPRVVLCDLMMPGGMSGFEFIARVRSERRTKDLPIIVVTGKDMTPDDRRLITGQIANVIRKGDLLMSDIESRLRETLEELGVKPAEA